ncbi:hypothetical protein [Acuticoccus mangrovi]|uniref:hypothetical protein n=1 Tax=Acuticoccus mangrovi TaxID=2796142 RepID=UPI001B3B68B6|nr:hypothetical protein [Acuticoccus mangrovi]
MAARVVGGLGLMVGLAAGSATAAIVGAEPAPVTVENRTAEPIACEASIAHWFSAAFGTAGPGASLALPLLRAPDGTVAVVSDRGEAMAVERVWCGRPGAAWQTRATLDLPRSEGAAVDWPELIICRMADRLICAPVR